MGAGVWGGVDTGATGVEADCWKNSKADEGSCWKSVEEGR